MKNLHDVSTAEEVKRRALLLHDDSERQWGTMSAPQAVAHCAASMEMALGESNPPRKLVGRLIGGIIKPLVLRDDAHLSRNSPTVDALIVRDQRNMGLERQRLSALIDRFVSGGSAACTTHPHPFFGPLTPDEWAILMYKHVDHHLRQFGV